MSLTKNVKPDLSMGISASYESESEVSGAPGEPDWSVVARVSVKLDKDSEVSYSLDKATGRAQAEVATQGKTADGSYSLKAQFEDDPNTVSGTPPEEQTTLNASYSGERFDVGASYSRQVLQRAAAAALASTVASYHPAPAPRRAICAFADNHIRRWPPRHGQFCHCHPPSLDRGCNDPGCPGRKGCTRCFRHLGRRACLRSCLLFLKPIAGSGGWRSGRLRSGLRAI